MPVADSKIPGPVLKGPKPRQTLNSRKAGFATSDLTIKKPKRPLTKPSDLQRKIFRAENQLLKSAVDCMTNPESIDIDDEIEPSGSYPSGIMPPKVTKEKRMIAPGTRDAPRFLSSKPSGLRRFIRTMEDLWEEAGEDDDQKRKCMIGKYADENTEEEWSAFTTYGVGYSWEEFKTELLENYPEAAAAERGTPARIRQLCADQSKVRLGDMPALYSFRRAFSAEASKLTKDPAIMGNRELVELFMGCLSDSFSSAILQHLGNKQSITGTSSTAASSSKGKAPAGTTNPVRRPEDRYDLKEIYDAASRVSENAQGIFSLIRSEANERGVYLFNQSASETKVLNQKVEELEGIQANERDRLESMNKTLESKIGGLEDMLKTLLAQSQSGGTHQAGKGDYRSENGKSHNQYSAPPSKWGAKSMEHENCFYCGKPGHFVADCPDQKEQIRIGNIKVNPEGKLRLRDGSYIPTQPQGMTTKERIERHYARKPSQFFYGEYDDVDPISLPASQYVQYSGSSETAEQRITRLEAELELRKREESLELRKRKIEQDEKKLEQSSGSNRSANHLDLIGQLTDEEVAAIRAARSVFP